MAESKKLKDRYNRIVIKIGSSTLTHNGGKLNLTLIDRLLRQIVDLKNQGREILLVTSGAIAAGMGELNLSQKPQSIKKQQAAAAVGQGQLIGIYNKLLREYGEQGAQVLLTASDLEDRTRYLNAFNTLDTLLDYGIIPIINENDTVVTEEIQFGDNDTLSARVAGLVEAELLINLTDTKGLYNQDPARDCKDLKIIHRVDQISTEIEKMAGSRGSDVSTGGMYTKIEAARIAVESGITMIIGYGAQKNILLDIIEMLEQKKDFSLGTTFLPAEETLSKRKHWFCFNLETQGEILVDKGAARALLQRDKSLLPGGVLRVDGDFKRGDLVNIINQEEAVIAKGLVNYSADEVRKIKGSHSSEINDILNYVHQDEIIHKDNLVLLR